MEQSIFYELSLALALAAGISLVARKLRQPPIIGYIISGFLIGPSLLNVIHAEEAFNSFSQIGIALLLFMVGLGLNVAIIKSTGKSVLVAFLAVALGLGGVGYGASWLLGFTPTESLLTTLALLFSSTIIVVKAISDKEGQARLYGQLAIGILLLEDIVATLALLVVSANSGSSTTLVDVGVLLLKALGLAGLLALVGTVVMPRVTRFLAASQELLFLFSLAWAFGVASAFASAGFSLEVGALFAGVALAHLPYAQGMSTRLKPLRDFFIILFFIGLGTHLGVSQLGGAIGPALLFSIIVMLLKPLMTIAGLGMMGYTKQTSFKSAVHRSQISEFSIILIVLAATTNLVSEHVVTIITLTALITITLSTYLMQHDTALYRWLENALSLFERTETKRELQDLRHYSLILLGYRKGGDEFVRTFQQMKEDCVVVDFDPEIAKDLKRRKIAHVYGDATDLELLDEIGAHHAQLIVSSISDAATNRLLAEHIMRHSKQTLFICHAHSYDEAAVLYKLGATYVILPHFVGSKQVGALIRHKGLSKRVFEKYRQEDLAAIGRVIKQK